MTPSCHLPLLFFLAALLVGSRTTAARSTVHHITSYEVSNPLAAGARHATVVVADRELPLATTTELTAEEFDEEEDAGRDEEPTSTEDETSASLETPAPPQPSISNAAPPQRVTNKPERRAPSTTTTSTTSTTTTSTAAPTTTTTTRRARPTSPRATVPPATYGASTEDRADDRGEDSACPRREDIHPCQCLEIPSKIPGDVETVATCKNIRNQQVLSDALKGFQRHKINFFVLDSCKLPPFPNGLFHNVDIEWMEVLNSTVQFQKEFFGCSKGCL